MSMLLWMSPVFHNISMILSQKNHQKAIPPPLDLKVASKELSLSTVSLEPWLCERTLAEQRLLREPPGSSTFQLVASTVQVPPSQPPLRKRTTSGFNNGSNQRSRGQIYRFLFCFYSIISILPLARNKLLHAQAASGCSPIDDTLPSGCSKVPDATCSNVSAA